jgi:plasmid maintenance system antidote protein VapI
MTKIHTKYIEETVSAEEVFSDLIKKRGKSGAALRGLRAREGMTQIVFAKAIAVTQANLSAMENGRRAIGKEIAQRIAKKFGFDYRVFL